MRWAEVSLVTSLEAADAVSEILISEGCGGVAVEGSSVPASKESDGSRQRLAAYFPVDDRLPATLENIRHRVIATADAGLAGADHEITVNFVEDEDWATAWRSFFKPLVVGNIVVKPTWEDFTAIRGQMILEIDPGMAFGTGNHPTTRMCLMAEQRYVRRGDTVLDMGTGSGILAIAAALLGASGVVGVDIDPIATKAARENVKVNAVEPVVRILDGESPDVAAIEADVVVANIVASAIIEMKTDLISALKAGGLLITSGIIDVRAEEVESALVDADMNTVEIMREGEWATIISRKS